MENSNEGKKNKRSRKGLYFAVFAGILSAVAVVLACTVFFRVETIDVQGSERYAPEDVIDASGVLRGTYLVLIPKEQTIQRIKETLPYVRSVELDRHFPTTLRLTVTDDYAAARVTSGDSFWLLDPQGKVLEQAQPDADYGCLTVTGLDLMAPVPMEQAQVLDENGGQLKGLIALMTALEQQQMLGQITEINAGSKTEISMIYQGRLRVKFMIGADYDRKIRIFREIVALIGEYETGTVDLKTERGCFTPTL